MNEKKEFDSDIDFSTLGHYVEGDYMTTEEFMQGAADDNGIIFSQENIAGFRISVHKDQIISVMSPTDKRWILYDFDNKGDWEDFCEATWQTENYIPMKRKDFIEFFRALQFVYSYHKNQLGEAKKRQAVIQTEIDKQETNLSQLQQIIIGYEEVYNESKV